MTSPTVEGPRSSVLVAGQRLLGSKGHGFTVDELVREAGVALQTFYRYFGGKDQLLVALIGEQISEHCARLRLASDGEDDPVVRLRRHLELTLAPLRTDELARARFIAAEHWRLHQLVPDQLTAATQPFVDLIRAELDRGQALGSLEPRHASLDAWLITRTVMSVVHHFAFSPAGWSPTVAYEVADHCISAVGGTARATPRRAARARASRSAAAPGA